MIIELIEDFTESVKFYLKYKDKPKLLIKENKNPKVIITAIYFIITKNFEKYNKWLFKFVFKKYGNKN